MKLIINVKPLTPPLTGIGHYTAELSRYLLQADTVQNIRATKDGRWLSDPELACMITPQEASQKRGGQTRAGWQRLLSARQLAVIAKGIPFSRHIHRMLVGLRLRLCRQAQPTADYLYWEPGCLSLPLQYRQVVTVYDLSHLVCPQYHPAGRVALLNQYLGPTIRQAAHLVAISEFTKAEVMRHFDIPEARISVVPPGVADEFYQIPAASRVAQVRECYNLPPHYVLFVGTLEPRKNVSGLLRAFLGLKATLRQRFPLVLVGVKGWLSAALEQQLQPHIDAGEVIRLGYVEQPDLPVLYREADVFSYVSHYEGYGMPIAEAMASGTAVLTSNCSSMPEVAQGAAVLVSPQDSAEITEQLAGLLEDEQRRALMAQAGQQIAAAYRWTYSGEKLLKVLAGLYQKD